MLEPELEKMLTEFEKLNSDAAIALWRLGSWTKKEMPKLTESLTPEQKERVGAAMLRLEEVVSGLEAELAELEAK